MANSRNNKDLTNQSAYLKVGQVDNRRLAELMLKAKGLDSVRTFAKKTGVNASTISRVINQGESMSYDLICRVVENAEEGSGVTIEDFVKAAGLVRLEGATGSPADMAAAFEQSAKSIIIKELEQYGYCAREELAELRIRGAGYSIPFDVAIKTDVVGDDGQGLWMMEMKRVSPNHGTAHCFQWLNMIMGLFYCQKLRNERVSLVINQPGVFEELKKQLQGLLIPDMISVILVDTTREKVIEEYVIPNTCENVRFVFNKDTTDGNNINKPQAEGWDVSLYGKEGE